MSGYNKDFNDDRLNKKVEAAIPVQSRVDIRALAEMVMYWEDEGSGVSSMSQLVNWSVDLCSQMLKVCGMLNVNIDTLEEANRMLIDRGLYQSGVMKRGRKKLIRGRQLENLRGEGINVKSDIESRSHYAQAHNRDSVVPAPNSSMPITDRGSNDPRSPERQAEAMENYRKIELAAMPKEATPDEIIAENKERMKEFKLDENGVYQIPPHGRGDYTETDRLKDKREEKKREKVKTLKQCEDIKRESEEKIKAGDDRMASMSQEELDRKHKEREARDKAERDAFDSVDVGDLNPVELDD